MSPLTSLFVALVISCLPAVIFVLFWRFLTSLRDDTLIRTLERDHDLELKPVTFSTIVAGGDGGSAPPALVSCPHCSVETITDRGTCVICGESVE